MTTTTPTTALVTANAFDAGVFLDQSTTSPTYHWVSPHASAKLTQAIITAQNEYYLAHKDDVIDPRQLSQQRPLLAVESLLICAVISDSLDNNGKFEIIRLFDYQNIMDCLVAITEIFSATPYVLSLFSLHNQAAQRTTEQLIDLIEAAEIDLAYQLKKFKHRQDDAFGVTKLWQLIGYIVQQLAHHQRLTAIRYSETNPLLAEQTLAVFEWYQAIGDDFHDNTIAFLTDYRQQTQGIALTKQQVSQLTQFQNQRLTELLGPPKLSEQQQLREDMAIQYSNHQLQHTEGYTGAYLEQDDSYPMERYTTHSRLNESHSVLPQLYKEPQEVMLERIENALQSRLTTPVNSRQFASILDGCVAMRLGKDSNQSLLAHGYHASLMDALGVLSYLIDAPDTKHGLWVLDDVSLQNQVIANAIYLGLKKHTKLSLHLPSQAAFDPIITSYHAFFGKVDFTHAWHDEFYYVSIERTAHVTPTKPSTTPVFTRHDNDEWAGLIVENSKTATRAPLLPKTKVDQAIDWLVGNFASKDAPPDLDPVIDMPPLCLVVLTNPSSTQDGYQALLAQLMTALSYPLPQTFVIASRIAHIDPVLGLLLSTDELAQTQKRQAILTKRPWLRSQALLSLYQDNRLFVLQHKQAPINLVSFATNHQQTASHLATNLFSSIAEMMGQLQLLCRQIAIITSFHTQQHCHSVFASLPIAKVLSIIEPNLNLAALLKQTLDMLANGQLPYIVVTDSAPLLDLYVRVKTFEHYNFDATAPATQIDNYINQAVPVNFPTVRELLLLLVNTLPLMFYHKNDKVHYIDVANKDNIELMSLEDYYHTLSVLTQQLTQLLQEPSLPDIPLLPAHAINFQMSRYGYRFLQVDKLNFTLTPNNLSADSKWSVQRTTPTTLALNADAINIGEFDGVIVEENCLIDSYFTKPSLNRLYQILLPQSLNQLESYRLLGQFQNPNPLAVYHYFSHTPVKALLQAYLTAKSKTQSTFTMPHTDGDRRFIIQHVQSALSIDYLTTQINLYKISPVKPPVSVYQAFISLSTLSITQQTTILDNWYQFLQVGIQQIPYQPQRLVYDLHAVFTHRQSLEKPFGHMDNHELFFKLDYTPISASDIMAKTLHYLDENIEQITQMVKQHIHYEDWLASYGNQNTNPEAMYFLELSEFEQLLYIYKKRIANLPYRGMAAALLTAIEQLPSHVRSQLNSLPDFKQAMHGMFDNPNAVPFLVNLLDEHLTGFEHTTALRWQVDSYVLLSMHLQNIEQYHAYKQHNPNKPVDANLNLWVTATQLTPSQPYQQAIIEHRQNPYDGLTAHPLLAKLSHAKANLLKSALRNHVIFTVGYKLPSMDITCFSPTSMTSYLAFVGQDQQEPDVISDIRHLCQKSDEEQFTYQQSLLTLQYANKQNTQDALACVHEGINFAPTDPLTLVATNQYELGFPASLFHGEPINTKQLTHAFAGYSPYHGLVNLWVSIADLPTMLSQYPLDDEVLTDPLAEFNFTNLEGQPFYAWRAW